MGDEERSLCFNFSSPEQGVGNRDSGESVQAIVFDLEGEERRDRVTQFVAKVFGSVGLAT